MKSSAVSSLVLSLAWLTALPLAAQSTGSIVGQVTDLSGAFVAGAKVVVKSVETGVERPTTTTSEGYYSVRSLPPADYVVSAVLPGFKQVLSSAAKVDTTATVRVDLVLVPLDSKTSVQVTARPSALQTETSMTGDTVNR